MMASSSASDVGLLRFLWLLRPNKHGNFLLFLQVLNNSTWQEVLIRLPSFEQLAGWLFPVLLLLFVRLLLLSYFNSNPPQPLQRRGFLKEILISIINFQTPHSSLLERLRGNYTICP